MSIESVRMNVPLTVATPSTIAIAVSAVRSLRVRRPLSAKAHRAAISSIASPISCCVAPDSSRTMRPSAR